MNSSMNCSCPPAPCPKKRRTEEDNVGSAGGNDGGPIGMSMGDRNGQCEVLGCLDEVTVECDTPGCDQMVCIEHGLTINVPIIQFVILVGIALSS